METTKILLKNLIDKLTSQNKIFTRNILKEYLQITVLDFIYSHDDYSKLIFYGGSCLAHCFGLPRLSEDLDFVDPKRKINLLKLADDLEKYFGKNTDLEVKITTQKFRLYLKFPILKELGLAENNESALLFLKIEIFKDFNFCKNYKTEMIPLFKFNKSMLIRSFDLPTLMATKIRAIFRRKWEKTNKKGKILARVKGRDYFDLMWYLERGVKPNLECLENVKDIEELKNAFLKIIEKIDSRSIKLDLESLIDNQDFIKRISKNIKEILKEKILKMNE